MISGNELRQKFLDYFKGKEHTIISSASLIPENDPTVLFTTAGMHPLVPYLMGESHAGGKCLADAQKCIRTGDIEEVGDSTHHTFFEMMGNWSLGDYFKKESITFSWEFLTSSKWLNLNKNLLAVSVFKGDEDAPFDEESYNIWKELVISENRIAKLPKKNNWWGPAGQIGPCGPDTEIFYWTGDPAQVPDSFNDDNDSWVEIWNNVFMQYNKNKAGKYEPLKQKNIDTGLGLERVLAVMNGLDDNYKTDLFIDLIKEVELLSRTKYEDNKRIIRIIVDHIKAATFIIGDDKGVSPSNTDQGYVVRRLIRLAIKHGQQLGIKDNLWTNKLAKLVIDKYQDVYPELIRNKDFIIDELNKEENKFSHTLENGLKELKKIIEENNDSKIISGSKAFMLYQSFGFPPELIKEELANYAFTYNEDEFGEELKKHQDLSRTASAGKFKGGLTDSGEETTKLHTAAHLLLSALRKVLGDHVYQKGSNITPERLRLDFSHPEKMSPEQIKQVEDMVNTEINKALPVICENMPLTEAKKKGAMGVFDSKYEEEVKVYKIGESTQVFSYEICGGPHVDNISSLGKFKIIKEESSSSGVRRIKAILEK